MSRVFIFILLIGYLSQNSGATGLLKKAVTVTELCSYDSNSGEENASDESSSDIDKTRCDQKFNFIFNITSYIFCVCIQFYPPGFSTDLYLPPR